MAGLKNLLGLPDEILQQVFYYMSPEDTLIIQGASKRLTRLANEPLLWRHHCRTSFKYWDSKHRILNKLLGDVSDVDWKKVYFYRRDVDVQTTRTLDSILSGQTRRIEKFERISQFGYDAKDTLLRHCATLDTEEDVLARRFYSNAVLDHVHRAQALEEWWRLSKGDNITLERALGAYDLFILHDEYGDLQEISDLLDRLTLQLLTEHPNIGEWSPRRKALTAANFLKINNLTGIASELQYRDLKNSYIGIALQYSDHPSLPLISVAIFCGVAERLSLKAHCCESTNHVYAVVYPAPGETLDGRPSVGNTDMSTPMYLDPYRSDVEVPVEHLRTQLTAYGSNKTEFHLYLGDSGIGDIVLRNSRNIVATIHEYRSLGGSTDDTSHPNVQLYSNAFADMDSALYSAIWANFMLWNSSARPEHAQQNRILRMILERFERFYPMDANLIERYICPPFSNVAATDHCQLFETLRVVRAGDSMPRQIRTRDSLISIGRVKYQVGQVFLHKRYGYTAVIIGWDIECSMTSQWIEEYPVDSLDKGRQQSFYHALVDDTSIRYVAEESVSIIKPDIPTSLMSLAGRYFKRWDVKTHRFISNVRDEYPDD